MPDFFRRLATFLMLLGVALLAMFLFSDAASVPDYTLFFYGLIVFAAGMALRLRHRPPPPPPSNRFRLFGRLRGLFRKKDKS